MTHGIGHNRPPQPTGWQRHCWTRARKELVGERLPLEMIKVRMARARELGLSFPQYRSILLGGGRDITAFLFTAEGLHLKLTRELSIPDAVRDKLGTLRRADLLALSPSGEVPRQFADELGSLAEVTIKDAGAEPEPHYSWSQQRAALRDLLRANAVPAASVVMIGRGAHQQGWAEAAELVKYLPRDEYFAESA
ncbi:hypothetical protein POI8812_01765 [Pontivivens insulae]|uniref:Uncharacterized protein n=1 Tax=Pontivivens insulae TaxID=1639689 RepID=A0A2R8ABJ3_9RHOB|nr:hypothetical protein DFR53_3408 [Pontivivens insulae]SPF29455.1 hypothetical protein POI8812_01765 [Pontivivens insulae]